MKKPIAIVEHLARDETTSTGYAPPVFIEHFDGLEVSKSSEDNRDTASFSLVNHRVFEDDSFIFTSGVDFSTNDKINIYAYNEDEFTGSLINHLLLSGTLDTVNYDVETDDATFELDISDSSDIMMNVKVPATYSGKSHNKDTAEMIKDLAEKTNNQSGVPDSQKIKASKAELDSETHERIGGGYIWPTQPDGTPFPVVDYLNDYSNLNSHLSTLSSSDYLGQTQHMYIYYIDRNRNLHFEPIDDKRKGVLDEFKDPPSQISKEMDTGDMINVVLINPGRGPTGEGNLVPVYNMQSVQKHGANWRYITKKSIGDKIMEYEKRDPEYLNPGNEIGNDMFPESYPWRCNQSADYKDQTYSVRQELYSDDDFKNYIKTKIRARAENYGNDIVNGKKHGSPKVKIEWEFPYGTDKFQINQRLLIKLRSVEFEREMIISEISHSFGTEWITKITLEERADVDIQ